MTTMGQRIRDRRKELGLRTTELAQRLRQSESAVRNVENGTNGASIRRAEAYAEALLTTPEYLLFGTPPVASSVDDKGSKPATPPQRARGNGAASSEIRRLRKARGLSQAALAQAIGAKQQTIDRIERGQTEWSRFAGPALDYLREGSEQPHDAPDMPENPALRVDGSRVTLNLTATVSVGVAARILALIEEDGA